MKNVAYIFDTDGGQSTDNVLFPGDEPDDEQYVNSLFGYSVAAARGMIAVGAPTEEWGRVYIFDKAAGTKCRQAKLKGEVEADEEVRRFGWSVEIGGTPSVGFVAVGNDNGVEIQPFST